MPDLRRPDHLPNLRPDRQPPRPDWLPKQRRGVTPQMIGRYPDFDVFDAADTWDAATRKVIEDRMALAGQPLRFFTPEQQPTLRAFCDTVMAQDGEPRIPVAEAVDAKLADGRLDGYQYADMPDDRQTWRLTLAGLDEAAADPASRDAIVAAFADGQLASASWQQLNESRAWTVVMHAVLTGFYSHPWAWNEIGFGGPAYPRGFMRLGPVSILEPFESPGASGEDPVRAVAEGEF
jgi:hypothetical protein